MRQAGRGRGQGPVCRVGRGRGPGGENGTDVAQTWGRRRRVHRWRPPMGEMRWPMNPSKRILILEAEMDKTGGQHGDWDPGFC